MTELICIVCPKGCHLKVDEENGYKVTGNGCPRGAAYGEKELVNPTRVITSTVKAEAKTARRVPVKTAGDIQLFSVYQHVCQLMPGRVIYGLNGSSGHVHLESAFLLGETQVIDQPDCLIFVQSNFC